MGGFPHQHRVFVEGDQIDRPEDFGAQPDHLRHGHLTDPRLVEETGTQNVAAQGRMPSAVRWRLFDKTKVLKRFQKSIGGRPGQLAPVRDFLRFHAVLDVYRFKNGQAAL